MEWTLEKPKVAGFYWLRYTTEGAHVLVTVNQRWGKLAIDRGNGYQDFEDGWEWAGPYPESYLNEAGV